MLRYTSKADDSILRLPESIVKAAKLLKQPFYVFIAKHTGDVIGSLLVFP